MTIQPIETVYSGHRFRSRLEARWAVAFDQLGIEWQYEAQGYACTHRLANDDSTFAYLPDFWLPDVGIFAEVKAHLQEPELVNLLNIAASLSSNNGAGCHDAGGYDLALLGPIPEPAFGGGPWILHMHKGDLEMSEWTQHPAPRCRGGESIAADYGGGTWKGIRTNPNMSVQDAIKLLLSGAQGPSIYWRDAYRAARSARFEHFEDTAELTMRLRGILMQHDLDTVEGRVGALFEAKPLIAAITNVQQRHSIARQFAIDSKCTGSLRSPTHWADPSAESVPRQGP